MKLTVHQAFEPDLYKDFARIPEQYRKDINGQTIEEGSVCKVSVGKKSAFVLLRGLQDESNAVIRVDERKRNQLGLELTENAEFRIEKVSLIGKCRWACGASDPAYQLSAVLGVWSFILGLGGIILGIIGLCK